MSDIPCVIVGSKCDLSQRYCRLLRSLTLRSCFFLIAVVVKLTLQRGRSWRRRTNVPGWKPVQRMARTLVSTDLNPCFVLLVLSTVTYRQSVRTLPTGDREANSPKPSGTPSQVLCCDVDVEEEQKRNRSHHLDLATHSHSLVPSLTYLLFAKPRVPCLTSRTRTFSLSHSCCCVTDWGYVLLDFLRSSFT